MPASYRALLLGVLCGLLTVAGFAAVRAGQDDGVSGASLHYTVCLESPQSQRVAVTATLAGIAPGREELRWTMQQRFAFVRLPEPLLAGAVRATGNGSALKVERVGPYAWDVGVAGHARVRLKYVVRLAHRTLDAVKERDAYEYPYVAGDHGMLVSPTLFLFPEEARVREIRVRFDLPEGWNVIAPWQRVGDREFDPAGREGLLNDLIAIGVWHVHEIRVGRFEGTIAFAPGQDALEQAAVEPIRRIVEYELKLFGREAEGRYLFLFGRPEMSGMAGSPKTHSMTLSVEPRLAPLAGKRLPHLIAHEFYHTWASALFEMPDELRWLNEGFTDYYAYLVTARLGFDAWEEFAEMLAEKMQQCATNPLRGKLSLVEAGRNVFFSDPNAYNLVYDGGLLVGAWLDRAIRTGSQGKTLDDLMRAFINDSRWSEDAAPTLKDFLATLRHFAGGATAAKLEGFVTQPYDLDPVAALAEVGVTIRHEVSSPRMDLRANLDGTRVIDIDHNWITYQVGVREGDRFIEVNGQAVSNAREVRAAWRTPVDKRIRMTLERDGKKLTIDEPLPQIHKFFVPVEPWREHALPGSPRRE